MIRFWLTDKPQDCLSCGEPLPIPRHRSMLRHPECDRAHRNTKEREKDAQRRSVQPIRHETKGMVWVSANCDVCGNPLPIPHHHSMTRHSECYSKDAGFLERRRESNKKYRLKLRKQVLDAYGHTCSCCGENRYEFLAIDHITGGGSEYRRQVRNPNKFLADIIRDGFPSEFRLLCHNCNTSQGYFGYCPHEVRQQDTKHRRSLRREIIEAYGSRCACCGESHYEFLAIDHVAGGGNQHRNILGGHANTLKYIKKQGYPPEFRVLCHNCNLARGFYGYCPHER